MTKEEKEKRKKGSTEKENRSPAHGSAKSQLGTKLVSPCSTAEMKQAGEQKCYGEKVEFNGKASFPRVSMPWAVAWAPERFR